MKRGLSGHQIINKTRGGCAPWKPETQAQTPPGRGDAGQRCRLPISFVPGFRFLKNNSRAGWTVVCKQQVLPQALHAGVLPPAFRAVVVQWN